jgi:hypothetical protein
MGMGSDELSLALRSDNFTLFSFLPRARYFFSCLTLGTSASKTKPNEFVERQIGLHALVRAPCSRYFLHPPSARPLV